ncbi:hypothetical protein L6164_003091 [Bauhinia variegata]|uniref:Uncharacterized protein n=1 Tax=Bauhinia variegata TaxID=167791 RepID=A0ACB9Q078_BAUVA|nr:hypothetical protein L6164_003091 [Bauhinia variegata]
MEFLSILVDKVLDNVLKPAERELGYLFCYKSQVNELNQSADDLQSKRERVQKEVEEAERNGRQIHSDVRDWLQEVEEIIPKTEEFQKDGGNAKTKWSSFNGLFPNMIVRHQLGRRAAKLTVDVNKLQNDSEFDGVSFRPSPAWAGAPFTEIGYESLESRIKIVEEIMKALKNSSVRTIGICGLGGVGKTTLVKEVANKATEMKLFNVVVMATVTKNPQIKNIQGQIADTLGMTLEEETETGRAGQLRERLRKDKENTLVILDDIWDRVDLNKLGIPVQDDDSSQKTMRNESVLPGNKSEKEMSGGCKIMLTSRSKEVLSTQMDVNENSVFSVGVLEEKEAETLFKKVTGLQDKNSEEFDSLASKIAKKCAGLPVAIVTIGRALKNKSSFVWNDALRQLERQEFTGVQESLEFSTKLSYDHLENEELKATFILCAQMGHDCLIVDLLKYCIGLGILEGVCSIGEARGKLNVLIASLKYSNLLLESYSSDRFTMHDIVRDAALSIAIKEHNALIKRYIKLDDWLDEDKLEKLQVLRIENNDHSLRIPDKFFEGMTKLRVLALTNIDLSHMPSSIKCLKTLRMLCLEECVIGEGLSLIGGLKKLKILSLTGSILKSFPVELAHNLQLLDMSDCSMLGMIPPDVLSCLNNLEELYMRNSLVRWDLEGKTQASLAELSQLHQLTALDIHIPDLNVVDDNLFFDALDYYKITIGDFKMFLIEGFKMPDKYEASRTLTLELKEGNDIHSQMGIKFLFKTVENLFLGKLNGVENIFYELNLQGFPCLKHLYIANNFEIKYIINSMNLLHPQEVFTHLESLHLYKLENMKAICCSQLTSVSFCKLKIVKIKMCHQIQSLFSFSLVRLLSNLETIEVSECDNLKEIVDIQRGGNMEIEAGHEEIDKIEFPQLQHVTLHGLSKLTGFYINDMLLFGEAVIIPNLESLKLTSLNISHVWGQRHPLSNSNYRSLIKLDVNNCGTIKYLLSFSMAGCLVNLKNLSVSNCEAMEELLTQEDGTNKTEMQIDIFPRLKEIKVSRMRNLTEIWHKQGSQVGSQSYCNLESVAIEGCKKLVTTFPPHMIRILRSLDRLAVEDCELMEVIFNIGNIPPTDGEIDACLRNIKLSFLANLMHVWNNDPKGIINFKNLQDVQVYGCNNIKNLFPFSVARGLKQLESLMIRYCREMEEIVGSRNGFNTDSVIFEFPKLTSVTFESLPELRSLYSGIHDIKWPQLKKFHLYDCDKLEAFTAETKNPERLPILSEQVIPNVLSLGLGKKEANLLSCCIDKFHLNSLKILRLFGLKNPGFLFEYLQRTPNLEELHFGGCDFQELLPPRKLAAQDKIGTVVQLKHLSLGGMLSLQNIGFEQHPTLFRQLQRLTISSCDGLISLMPGSISFTHLTFLQVGYCGGLKHLMETSTAKSLSQLTTLEITYCMVMEEIVAENENCYERENKIAFCRLTTLKLDSLKKLTSFCSSKYCSFMFPVLENLVVVKCPAMKIFSERDAKTPKLRKVYFVEGDDEGKWYWSNNLNDTVQKIFTDMIRFEYIEYLKLCDYPQLEQFWHGKVPLPDNCFTNLKYLTVEDCEFLSTVIPSNLLPYFNNLNGLTVRSCNSVEKIFDISDIKSGAILLQLRRLTLEKLPNLKNIFLEYSEYLKLPRSTQLEQGRQDEIRQPNNCFRSLQFFFVERCDLLSVVIPCNVVPCLKNLERLNVRSCRSMEKIFDINDEMLMYGTKGLAFPLKYLTLYDLPALKNVWNLVKDSQGIFSFPNLVTARVSSCQGLNFLFPASLAKDLVKLESLHIINCEAMKEVVGKDEATEEGAISKFKFPRLTTLTLDGLFKLRCFYPRKHNLEVPMLNSFKVFHCGKLEIFTQELQSYQEALPEDDIHHSTDGHALFSIQEVPKLENVSLNPRDTTMLSCGEFKGIKKLMLQCFHNINEGDTLPYGYLNNVPNIETLKVFCSGFKVIFPSQMPEVECTRMPAGLRRLSLVLLPSLMSIGLEQSYLDPFCRKLHVLKVRSCNRLRLLVQSAVSFCNLKELRISSCHGLEYLFTSSTAKSLVQLEKMLINSSKSIKEIVAEEEEESSLDEIIFGKLQYLSLKFLPSLLNFYAGNVTLSFPLLETVFVYECPKMKIFSPSIINAPILEDIRVLQGWEKNRSRWDTNLNTTIVNLLNGKVSLEQYVHLKLLDYPEAEEVWHNQAPLQKDFFGKLETLVVENCNFLSNVIPSYLVPYLKKLKKLQVKNCIQAEVIFDINAMNTATIKEESFPLEMLILDMLPNLKHVWNTDPEGIISFQNLQEVQVTRCTHLKNLFTTSLSKKLGKLEKLTIESCETMKEIVRKDEATVEGITTEFVFPWLTLLVISDMPELKFFFAGRYNLVCKNLKILRVYHCGKLEILALNSQIYQEGQTGDYECDTGSLFNAQPLFSIQKVIPKLEEVSLNKKEAMMLWHEESKEALLHNIKYLQLYCFHIVSEADSLPFGFLLKVPKIETLAIACSEFKEIFPSQRLEDDHIRKLAQLRGLRLIRLSELSSIGLEHSWQDRLCENLELLEILRCPQLTKIVQSAVSFWNLKELLLNKCDGLECLFTSSTAKSLVGLREMCIEECRSIKEILAKEECESTQDEIIFEQLIKISLNSLPNLINFYTGNSSLSLPFLHKVIITECPKMKMFSHGSISAPVLMGIQASLDEYPVYYEYGGVEYVDYDLHWNGNLNSTVEQMFYEKDDGGTIMEQQDEKDCGRIR